MKKLILKLIVLPFIGFAFAGCITLQKLRAPLQSYVPLGLARVVGSASRGFSGQT
jgi:hypothetical protein